MSRRAVVHLGTQQIERMLALPPGVRVLAARDDFIRDGVAVLVEGEQLEDQPPACVLPDLPLSVLDPSALAMRATATGDDGDAVELVCPLRGETACQWFWVSEGWPITLAKLADVVQQHLSEKHAEESAT